MFGFLWSITSYLCARRPQGQTLRPTIYIPPDDYVSHVQKLAERKTRSNTYLYVDLSWEPPTVPTVPTVPRTPPNPPTSKLHNSHLAMYV